MSEIGDISRFRSPRELMAYAGMVPSECSRGNRASTHCTPLSGLNLFDFAPGASREGIAIARVLDCLDSGTKIVLACPQTSE